MPSLLIVVPTLDSYVLLSHLVESLQQQTWTSWRVQFIDGPSGLEHRQWLERCCRLEPRCHWVPQVPDLPGIFGAMTQGFMMAQLDDWVLFWGSDDWAAAPDVLSQLMTSVTPHDLLQSSPDLVVCRGRYADSQGRLGRRTAFGMVSDSGSADRAASHDLNAVEYRRRLFLGATPPHQATLFGPGAIRRLRSYHEGLRLTADLDYFLRLSRVESLQIRLLALELVHMADAGVSGQQTRRRLQEVRLCYRFAFGWSWWVPFLTRYARRLMSRFVHS